MIPEMICLSHFSNESTATATATSTATATATATATRRTITSRYFSSSSRRDRRSEDESTGTGRRRSPYAILKLKTSATKEDIKSSFRKLCDIAVALIQLTD